MDRRWAIDECALENIRGALDRHRFDASPPQLAERLGTCGCGHAGALDQEFGLCHAAQLALMDGDTARARTLIDEALKLPAGAGALRDLVLAQVTHAGRGCAMARPLYRAVFDLAVEEGERSVQTMTTIPLAECELEARDVAPAKARVEAELAWLVKVNADDVLRVRVQRALDRFPR